MNMFNQSTAYLKASDYNTVVELLYNLSKGRYTMPDLSLSSKIALVGQKFNIN